MIGLTRIETPGLACSYDYWSITLGVRDTEMRTSMLLANFDGVSSDDPHQQSGADV